MDGIEDKEEMQDGYGRILKYLGIFGGAQGVSILLNMVRNKFATVLLGASGLTIIALFNRTIQMFSDSTGLSLSFSAIRAISDAFENGDDETVRHNIKIVRSLALLTGSVGMLLMLLVTPFISDWIFKENGYYLSRFLMLAPVVLFMAVSNGELAILRGIKQLNYVALYAFATALISLFVSIPLYYIMGVAGIFPSIFLIAFAQMCVLLWFSVRRYCYIVSPFSWRVIRNGADIVRLGAGYIFSSFLSSSALWLICALLSDVGNADSAGLFNAGLLMVTLMQGVLFAALDSEYYPRLSGVASKIRTRNRMVNEQVEVQLLVQSSLLMAFMVVTPIVVPMLYKMEFLTIVPMIQIAMFGIFLRTMTYPISFIPLSKNDSLVFLLMESVYNILLVIFVISGYSIAGYTGIGIGMALAHTVDFFIVTAVVHFKYKFAYSVNVLKSLLVQMPLFVTAIAVSQFFKSGWMYWLACGLCVLLSATVSICILGRRTSLPEIVNKFIKRILKK